MKEPRVECAEHGSKEATYVCQHLPSGRGLGFHQGTDPDAPDTWFPDAWCDACESVRTQEHGWNERSELAAAIQVLCSACYLKTRLLNWPRNTHVAEAELIRRSVEYLQAQQELLRSKYRLDDHERYDWDQESGRLVFSNQGKAAVVAEIQFVGSISTRSNTWLWSWANDSYLEKVRARVRLVRSHGVEHSLMRLACAYWGADPEDGWQMAAVAAYLLDAHGAYRSPDEHSFTFMVMTHVGWAQ